MVFEEGRGGRSSTRAGGGGKSTSINAEVGCAAAGGSGKYGLQSDEARATTAKIDIAERRSILLVELSTQERFASTWPAGIWRILARFYGGLLFADCLARRIAGHE